MSCRKVSRALLDRLRFGDLDADCGQYLEHIESCPECQHEVAVDRALARDLRRALRTRVEGFEPSPAVWRAVRLQAADPEPPGPWWAAAALSISRAMRVMVPATAVMLAAVLTWSGRAVGPNESAEASPLASRMQWEEQLTTTARVEVAERQIEIIPSPTIMVPRPGGEMPYPETVARIKISSAPPTSGGVIR